MCILLKGTSMNINFPELYPHLRVQQGHIKGIKGQPKCDLVTGYKKGTSREIESSQQCALVKG